MLSIIFTMNTSLRVALFSLLFILASAGMADAQTVKRVPDLRPGTVSWNGFLRDSKIRAHSKVSASGATAVDAKSLRATDGQVRAPRVTTATARGSQSTAAQALAASACFVPIDGTFSALPRDNDGSSELISLPFSFNLYGTEYNSVYINTNGSLSFLEPMEDNYSFPLPYFAPMIAPFWSDIDTRNPASGQIYYKVTPTHLIVTWDRVGYADEMADLVNTFQVIIGVPGDELLGPGINLKMNYGDMQWATAYENSLFPALVGINGDFLQHYQQIGLFDKVDASYDGPSGENDGVQYLANKCFAYDVRTLSNLPPQFTFNNPTRLIELNVGETIELEPFFTSPEPGQTVTTQVRIDEEEICKFTYSVTNGATSKVKMKLVGDLCNAGVHIVYLVATDDGNPQQCTTVALVFWVKADVPVIDFPTPVDDDGDGRYPLKATANGGQPIVYELVAGQGHIEGDTLIATGVGPIVVRAWVESEGQFPDVFKDALVCVAAKSPGSIQGDNNACLGFTATYRVEPVAGAIYNWTVEGGTLQFTDNEATVTWKSVGKHLLSVSYATGCGEAGPVSTLEVNVISNPLNGSITKMLPSDGNNKVSFPLTFSWFPVEKASSYDIYVWPATGTQPEDPLFTGITSINFTVYSHNKLEYGKTYKWRLVARGDCSMLESPVQTFQLRYLPDLVVRNIQVPPTGWSGQEMTVSWQVNNTGEGATLDQVWFDKVYLSLDQVLDDQDISVASKQTPVALNNGGSYTNSATFNVPNGLNNRYYVIVETNEYENVPEKDLTNNTGVGLAAATIQLTPPPDLQVSKVVPPNNAFSGQKVEVSWTVVNAGNGIATGAGWHDLVWLSREPVLNTATAIKLGSGYHGEALKAVESYTGYAAVTLPDTITGTWYVHVVADWVNVVYEHANDNNNIGTSDPINIVLTPPADLTVNSVTVPATAGAGDKITVSWQVENGGGSGTFNKYWRDDVFLSPTPTYQAATAVPLGTAASKSNLGAGQSYRTERSYKLPAKLTGNYYLIVKTDALKDVFEQAFENNNEGHSPQAMPITAPDLLVNKIVSSATAVSGEHMNIEWQVKNSGDGLLLATQLNDRIYVSGSAEWNLQQAILVKDTSYLVTHIPSGGDTLQHTTIVMPNGLKGNYYIYVQTDVKDTAFESKENNNILRSTAPVAIAAGTWADLQVTDVQVSDSASAAEFTNISYTVINKGNKATNDSTWTDRIYLSQKSSWDPAASLFVRELTQTRNIAKEGSYQVQIPVPVPGNIGGAGYYVYVFTNAGKQVYEQGDTANNTGRSKSMYIRKYPPVDIIVTSVSAPAAGKSGNPISLKWSVRNNGQAITLINQWQDAVYLSADTVFDKNDTLVKSSTHRGALPAGTGYTDEQTVVLPNGISGKQYLLLVSDPQHLLYDADTANNVGKVRPQDGGNNDPIAIGIELTPAADLVVTSFTSPDEGYAGQPVKLKWVVKNRGAGATNAIAWTDKVYLSKDLSWNAGDILLSTYVHKGILAAGGVYEDSVEAFLPADDLGNHVLIYRSDVNDQVYEHQAEENSATTMITVVRDELSDLVITDIELPDTAMAGGEATIRWKLKNVGINPARGYLQQSLYLSTDTTKDVSDVLAVTAPVKVLLAPNNFIQQSQKIRLQGVSLREYYALVHADVLNNIAEVNDDNNITASAHAMRVSVEEMPLEVEKTASLRNNQAVYYRMEIPDSLVGESVLVSLKGDSLKGNNDLFIRYGDVPDRAAHDFSAEKPFQGSQEIIIPALQAGTYYLMVSGRMGALDVQSISLLASVLHFEIRSVEAAEGGNTGQATILVKGSKMDVVKELRLRNGGSVIVADKIDHIDPTSLYARVDLDSAALGAYDVVVENEAGDTAVSVQGFKVVPGTAAQITTNVIAPPNTRPTNVLSIRVEFSNNGNTDIVNPVVKLTSLGGAPIALKPGELGKAGATLTLPLEEAGGPAGRLRPGAKGTIIVYAKATTVLGFMLMDNEQ
ncbi:CARDB domain-containing protein [Paraflavitalea sp. CAU 1676]|uniref:CARDB domain-containing protein n=1 Tax=Paraflavitalea sp. CAU 1676 TaxID=3032598 RepID=UPI0023DB99B4|nr:CARDB domain-containing protein [Paraflavitalea sp. CAU 1676]MDF2191999.1 CARDB domain-containing protein [Paraflavitalea sp. CAU 1676]